MTTLKLKAKVKIIDFFFGIQFIVMEKINFIFTNHYKCQLFIIRLITSHATRVSLTHRGV
jgi:hypothetical protein